MEIIALKRFHIFYALEMEPHHSMQFRLLMLRNLIELLEIELFDHLTECKQTTDILLICLEVLVV